jgi:hypothetical protein
MRKLIPIFALLAIVWGTGTGRALDLTLDSPTVNAGSQVTINVIWSSTTALNYLSTEFIVTAVGGAAAGEVTFANTPIDATTGTPALPNLNATNYLFYGDSDDYISLSGSNPASVYTTNWAYDTYNMSDSTNSGTDYTQDGTRLWTVLTLNTTGLAAGQYQIISGSSAFDTTAQTGQTPTLAGGLITVNAVVPEPSTWLLAALATGTMAVMNRRRKKLED